KPSNNRSVAPSGSASTLNFWRRPSFFQTSSNGLASGNTAAEARLHAIYELIERDAMCALSERGRINLGARAHVIDPDSVTFPLARLIIDRCHAQDIRVVLVALPAAAAVSAIWAIFRSQRSVSTRSLVNMGWGAHVDPEVAVVRALTEAAQTRLAKIHGARDDIRLRIGTDKNSRPYRVLECLTPNTGWQWVEARPRLDLPSAPEAAVARLVDELIRTGKGPIYDFDMGNPEKHLSCVRIVAPRLAFRKALF
ncbi:MAG: YcaO-like family protein, partial [Deltaproteobacteria bacterium]|nr:YcaO-like family protein [Deltaproteobacteria bacterium]